MDHDLLVLNPFFYQNNCENRQIIFLVNSLAPAVGIGSCDIVLIVLLNHQKFTYCQTLAICRTSRENIHIDGQEVIPRPLVNLSSHRYLMTLKVCNTS